MSFLNPAMLFGIAAITIPIIIHLLNRRKFQRITWAAMRFLKVSVEQNQRRIRLEDILLLVIRCFLIFLIALAMARPAMKSNMSNVLSARSTSVIILDNSYSMSLEDGVGNLFSRAKKICEEIVSSLKPGSSCAFYLSSDITRQVIPEPTQDFNLLRKEIRKAELSGRGTDVFPSLKLAIDMLASKASIRKEVFIITDGQAIGWKNWEGIRQLLLAARRANIQVYIIIVGDAEERNLCISRFSIATGLCPINHPIRFEVQVSNFGIHEEKDIRVSLSVENNPPLDSAIIESIKPRESKTVSLFAKFYKDDFYALTARLEKDRLPADDSQSLVVKTIKEARILVVDGNPGAEPRLSQSFYLKHAIAPVPPSEVDNYFLKLTIIEPHEISNVRFDDYDVVFMLDVSELSPQVVSSLDFYLKRGGGLVIFPGRQTRPDYYNRELFEKTGILPAIIGNMIGKPDETEKFFHLQERNYIHPIVEIWNDPASGNLASARFYAFYELKLPERSVSMTNSGSPAHTNFALEKVLGTRMTVFSNNSPVPEPRVVLNYNNGMPAIVEKEIGFGRVFLFSSTANTDWNDFPIRPSFLPLIHRIIGALLTGRNENLTIKTGDIFSYKVENEFLGKDVVISPPTSSTNSNRGLTRVDLVNGLPTIRYDETDLSGIYEVMISGEIKKNIKFAAQFEAEESDLTRLSDERLKVLSVDANLIEKTQISSLRQELEKNKYGVEIWLPIALFALMLAIVETGIAQYFSRTK